MSGYHHSPSVAAYPPARRGGVVTAALFITAALMLGGGVALLMPQGGGVTQAVIGARDDGPWAWLAAPIRAPRAAVLAPATEQVARSGRQNRLDAVADPMNTGSVAPPIMTPAPAGARLALITTPPAWKLEKSWKLAAARRKRILAQRRQRQRELACLATAIYFEARSESRLGQLAVAKVVLNRVKDRRFPNTICGVVYENAHKRNACQFSFACDGKSERPTEPAQWRRARRLAAEVLNGQADFRPLNGVAFYHADYVWPRWRRAMRRVIKIGRHIFYRG